MIRKILVFLMLFFTIVASHPTLNCEGFCCPKGYRYITATAPVNVACLGGVCTTSTCCYVPTCASAYGYWGTCSGTALLKAGSDRIQCPSSGCTPSLCCN